MALCRVNSHEVEVSRIVSVQPLVMNSKMLSPEAGLNLVLDEGPQHKWVAEKDGPIPSVGDLLIQDHELHVRYIVDATKFKTLFQETSREE